MHSIIEVNFPLIQDGNTFKIVDGLHGGNHTTNSESSEALLKYYSHSCYIRLMIDYYQRDYEIFKIPYPEWALEALENTNHHDCIQQLHDMNKTLPA
jgi:hypothetical protein